MRKTKFAFVSVLSLLVVVAPVSSVLAQNEPVEKPIKEKSQQTKQKAEKDQTSVFEEIEKQGGNEVSDRKLDQEEGEGLFGAIAGGIVGAGLAVWDGISSGDSPSSIAVSAFSLACVGIAAGAVIPEP